MRKDERNQVNNKKSGKKQLRAAKRWRSWARILSALDTVRSTYVMVADGLWAIFTASHWLIRCDNVISFLIGYHVIIMYLCNA